MALTKITRELLSTGIDDNSNATAITIDSSERVGINVTSPTAKLSLPAQASGDSGIARFAIESAVDSNDFTIAQYEDGTGTYTQIGQNISLTSGGNVSVLDSGHKTAGITFDGRGNGALMFQTGAANANTEKMRIDSSGDIKNTGGTTTTHTIFADSGSSEGTANITFNTDGASTDQALANIKMTQDGGTAQKGEMYFQVSDNGAPATAISIFNNKYVQMAAGITFGGDTATANLLDDYEEGSWTPAFEGTSTSVTVHSASYTKIGRLVHITCYLSGMTASNNGSMQKVTGLPFDHTSTTWAALSIGYCGTVNLNDVLPITEQDWIYFHQNDGSSSTLTRADFYSRAGGAFPLIMSGVYMTSE